MPYYTERNAQIVGLINTAEAEIAKHDTDEAYYGSSLDIVTGNRFFADVSAFVGFTVTDDDTWGPFLARATTTEAYQYAINQLTVLKLPEMTGGKIFYSNDASYLEGILRGVEYVCNSAVTVHGIFDSDDAAFTLMLIIEDDDDDDINIEAVR